MKGTVLDYLLFPTLPSFDDITKATALYKISQWKQNEARNKQMY